MIELPTMGSRILSVGTAELLNDGSRFPVGARHDLILFLTAVCGRARSTARRGIASMHVVLGTYLKRGDLIKFGGALVMTHSRMQIAVVVAFAAAAFGWVEAPARSMVAWVFTNSVDYVNGCNVGDNSDQMLERNYRLQIEDDVAAGARAFLRRCAALQA